MSRRPGRAETLWTIGHSTRPLEELLAALKAHRIATLVDVRAFPASRRHPQFSRASLEAALPAAGIVYRWLGAELGGRRKARPDSMNKAIRSAGLRGYADYMGTAPFRAGLEALLALAREAPTAVMCAERLWWKCHRSMISDYAALGRGWTVLHIDDEAEAKPHRVKPEARRYGDEILYGEPDLFDNAV